MTDNIRNASSQAIQYRAPQVKVIPVKPQNILCVSNPDANTTEMGEGDDNW